MILPKLTFKCNSFNVILKTPQAKELEDDMQYTEIYVDQILQVKNMEVIYEDFTVSAFMAVDGLWDPTTIQDEELEESCIGTCLLYTSDAADE